MNDEHKNQGSPSAGSGQPPEVVEKEKYLRLAADFDNYRKQMESTLTAASVAARVHLWKQVLDWYDQVVMLRRYAPEDENYRKALEIVLTNFEQVLRQNAVKKVPALGEKFDPRKHEPISDRPPEESGKSQTVAEVVRDGYEYLGNLIRPAQVIIYQ